MLKEIRKIFKTGSIWYEKIVKERKRYWILFSTVSL